MAKPAFTCYVVARDDKGEIQRALAARSPEDLPQGEVLIRVGWSSVNYKDALAATGHPGVAKRLPHVPGIDAAGIVEESSSPEVPAGEQVLVTGYELGAGIWGGWSEYIRVPAEWVVPIPHGLTVRSAMALGTAGFTAAQCVWALQHHSVEPEGGEVLVTGATGGVGCLAVLLLAKLGYKVVASTGKHDRQDWLKQLGAARVVPREEVVDTSDRPLLKTRWAGAVDTVGGPTLVTLLRSTDVQGCVAACGLVGGDQLPSLSVYPFILRGVVLAGITSALCPRPRRLEIWKRLAGPWKLEELETVTSEIGLEQLDACVDEILRGQVAGRRVVKVQEL